MFQHRKARGMKIAGGIVLTDVMFAVKTGKIIVTAKHTKTAVAKNGMRMKSVPRGIDTRVVDERLRVLDASLVASLVAASPSDVPFAVAFAADSKAEWACAILLCRRIR